MNELNRYGLIKVLCSIVFAAVFSAGTVWAGGIGLYEIGTSDVGLAAAGYAARASDASTVFTNPAGMSCLDQSQVMVGIQALYGNVEFSPTRAQTLPAPTAETPSAGSPEAVSLSPRN